MDDRVDPIFIVDEHETDRDLLNGTLKTCGYRTATWSSVDAFLACAQDIGPGCVVIDWCAPMRRNPDLQRPLFMLARSFPTVLVVNKTCDLASAIAAMKRGVVDILTKPVEPSLLIAAIGDAQQHGRRLRSGFATEEDARARLALLSAREHEVLERVVTGASNKTIAIDLNISSRTVEVHRARMMQKLNVTSLAQAIRIALAAGLA